MSKTKKLCTAAIRSVILVVLHILFTQLAYFTAYPEESEFLIGYNAVRHIIVSGIIFVCFYYSFVRVQTVYNTPLREKYLAAEGNVSIIALVFLSFDFWSDLLVYSAVVLAAYGKVYSFVFDIFGEGSRLFALAATLPILAIIGFIARFNATRIWNRTLDADEAEALQANEKKPSYKADKLIPTIPTLAAMRFITRANTDRNPALETEQAVPFDYGMGGMIKSHALVFAIFLLASLFGRAVYSIVSLVLVPLSMLTYAKYAATIFITVLVAIPIIRRLKALTKRASLVSKTKKLCKENKYRLSAVKAPFASLFSSVRGESFSLTVNGETFSCKLLATKKASTPIILHEDGSGETLHTITFIGIKWLERRKPFRFGYESKNRQILIINPSAKFICSEKNGTLTELDNGDSVGNYIIYSGTGFTNALDRKTLGVNDKDKNKYKYI